MLKRVPLTFIYDKAAQQSYISVPGQQNEIYSQIYIVYKLVQELLWFLLLKRTVMVWWQDKLQYNTQLPLPTAVHKSQHLIILSRRSSNTHPMSKKRCYFTSKLSLPRHFQSTVKMQNKLWLPAK